MGRLIAADRDTAYLPPSVDEWLPQDHLARFVVEVVDQLDLSDLVRQYAGRGMRGAGNRANAVDEARIPEHCCGLRKQTVEPVLGIIKRVMGWSQMSMRGLDKARGEWSLVTMSWLQNWPLQRVENHPQGVQASR